MAACCFLNIKANALTFSNLTIIELYQ